MKYKNPLEKKSLQEKSRQQHLFDEGINVPLYADDLFKEELRQRQFREEIERNNEEYQRLKEEERKEKQEYKSKLLKFHQLNGHTLSTCAILLILAITSLAMESYLNAIYSIIGIFVSIYIGKRLTFNIDKFDDVLNVLLWNITQTLNDFIEHKIDYEIKESYEGIISKATLFMSVSLLLFNSNSIVYGFSLLALILGFLMALAYRDLNSITISLNRLILFAIIGIFIKTIISYFIFKVFTIDFFNIVLVNIFLIINMLKDIELQEPLD